mmetsp:Transcript_102779/g.182597  ORF Transcript_102779/g.182597 Transcript_102779/m.182597 type:complete len:264 (+) Transcript_102779:412-1203(+)
MSSGLEILTPVPPSAEASQGEDGATVPFRQLLAGGDLVAGACAQSSDQDFELPVLLKQLVLHAGAGGDGAADVHGAVDASDAANVPGADVADAVGVALDLGETLEFGGAVDDYCAYHAHPAADDGARDDCGAGCDADDAGAGAGVPDGCDAGYGGADDAPGDGDAGVGGAAASGDDDVDAVAADGDVVHAGDGDDVVNGGAEQVFAGLADAAAGALLAMPPMHHLTALLPACHVLAEQVEGSESQGQTQAQLQSQVQTWKEPQ